MEGSSLRTRYSPWHWDSKWLPSGSAVWLARHLRSCWRNQEHSIYCSSLWRVGEAGAVLVCEVHPEVDRTRRSGAVFHWSMFLRFWLHDSLLANCRRVSNLDTASSCAGFLYTAQPYLTWIKGKSHCTALGLERHLKTLPSGKFGKEFASFFLNSLVVSSPHITYSRTTDLLNRRTRQFQRM